MQTLRKTSRPASREDSAGHLFLPSACSGAHKMEMKICDHQMKLLLGNEAGTGKTEKIILAVITTPGIG